MLCFSVFLSFCYSTRATFPPQREDLELSVGSKAAVWEVKDPLLVGPGAGDYMEEDMCYIKKANIGPHILYESLSQKKGNLASYKSLKS